MVDFGEKVTRKTAEVKEDKRKFVPFGTEDKLLCLGMSKVKLRAVAGATICSLVYIIHGVKESLMGCMDALRLGQICQACPAEILSNTTSICGQI